MNYVLNKMYIFGKEIIIKKYRIPGLFEKVKFYVVYTLSEKL